MNKISASSYIDGRLKEQMEYYEDSARTLRTEYYTMSVVSIMINAAIPVLSMAMELNDVFRYAVAILSATSSILASILLLRKTREGWIRYRHTDELLRRELTLFSAGVGKYRSGDEELFILSCENIMESENEAWKETNDITMSDRN